MEPAEKRKAVRGVALAALVGLPVLWAQYGSHSTASATQPTEASAPTAEQGKESAEAKAKADAIASAIIASAGTIPFRS